MEISLKNLADPKKRLLIGILVIVIGAVCLCGQGLYSGVTRESCVAVEATYDSFRYPASSKDKTTTRQPYLSFSDYDSELSIHPSCVTYEMEKDLQDLPSGTKMKFLIDEETRTIYELEVAGKMWLDFDTAREKINTNMKIIDYIGYAALPLGVICFVSGLIGIALKKRKTSPDTGL